MNKKEIVERGRDFTFPLYFLIDDVCDQGGGYETAIKVESDGRVFEVTKRHRFFNDDHPSYEFHATRISLPVGLIQYVGNSPHAEGALATASAPGRASYSEARALLNDFSFWDEVNPRSGEKLQSAK